MEAILESRIESISLAYTDALRTAVIRHWGDRSSALHAIALYFETQADYVGGLDLESGFILTERVRDLLFAFRAILTAHPPSDHLGLFTFTTESFIHAREVLKLAGEARLFQELQVLFFWKLICAKAESDAISFSDPRGVLLGPVLQGLDDMEHGYQSALKLQIPIIRDRLNRVAEIESRERPTALQHIAASLRIMQASLPKRSARTQLVWAHPRDAIADMFAPQAAYRARLRLDIDVFTQIKKDLLPHIDESTQVGSVSWAQLSSVFSFLQAFANSHHAMARRADVPGDVRKRSALNMFVPNLGSTSAQRLPVTVLGDYLTDASTDSIVELACKVLRIRKSAVRPIIEACILRDLPADHTALHNHVFSGLIEVGPGRVLLVPTLGLNAADPDTLLRLARRFDPLGYDTTIGEALGRAPVPFAEQLRVDPNLRLVIEKRLNRPNGQRLTDIDLGIYDCRSNILVLLEFKSLWLQDASTLKSIEEKLQGAEGQLRAATDYFRRTDARHIGEIFKTSIPEIPNIVPAIVTRRHYRSGSQVAYPVVPHAALRRLLSESSNEMKKFSELLTGLEPVASSTERWKGFQIRGMRWRAPRINLASEIVRYPALAAILSSAIAFLCIVHNAFAQTAASTSSARAEPAIRTAQVAAAAAIISAVVTVTTSLFNEFRKRANDRKIVQLNAAVQERLAEIKRDNDIEVARVSGEFKARADLHLAEANKAAESRLSAEAARREYEYEARKRLYHECEPLLFQLSQNARVAIGRIISLARESREGGLDKIDGLLSGDLREDSSRGYYFRSTLYQLLAPLAIAYILQTRLTLQDTSLDRWVNRQFFLSEAAYKAFTRDFAFAEMEPVISGYRETADRMDDREGERRHDKQGIFLGRLDALIENLVDKSVQPIQLITFGKFEQLIQDDQSQLSRNIIHIANLFAGFSPNKRPVLWRILVAQYYLHRAIRLELRDRLQKPDGDNTLDRIALKPEKEHAIWAKKDLDETMIATLRLGHAYMARALGARHHAVDIE